MSAEVKRSNPDGVLKIYERLAEQSKKEVAVGFPEGRARAYDDGTPVATVAARHVYGMGVPKRDFMALARQQLIEKTAPLIQAAMKSSNPDPLMEAAGQEGQAAIQNAIVQLDDPPNAPGTLHTSVGGTNSKGKKSTNPLVDTSHMKNSVTYIVRKRTR